MPKNRRTSITELRSLNEALRNSKSLQKRRYTAPEVCYLTGVSARKLRYLEEERVLRPTFRDPSRRGRQHAAFYSCEDVIRALVITELMKQGIKVRQIKKLEKHLDHDGLKLRNCVNYLLTNGKSVFFEETPDKIVDVLKQHGQMLLICMYDRVEEMKRKLPFVA